MNIEVKRTHFNAHYAEGAMYVDGKYFSGIRLVGKRRGYGIIEQSSDTFKRLMTVLEKEFEDKNASVTLAIG